MNKLHVVIVGPHPPETGGPASHIYDLARTLCDDGYKVSVICREIPIANQSPIQQDNRYEILTTKGWKLDSFLYFPELYRLLVDCDVIHVHSYATAFLMNLARKIVPRKMLTTLHSYYVEEALGHGKKLWPLMKIVENEVIKRSDALIAVDSRISGWVNAKYGRKVSATVMNSLYMSDYLKFQHIKREESVIICPRHLNPKNGVHNAILALKLLNEIGKNHKLIIVGEGPERGRLEQLVRDLSLERQVFFLGNRPRWETVKLISQSKITLIPSVPLKGLEEATSIAALESMAVETPVVASGIGGLKEIIRNGYNGILVKPNSPQDLASAIYGIISNETLYNSIAKQSREYVWKERNWQKNIKTIESVYQGLLDENQGFQHQD